jgi:hypothetical protein|nr:MAG TPA: hypothetical protein [Caudoviricetes sp.]
MDIKHGAVLKVVWFDDTTSEYNYDSNKQLFIKTGVDRAIYFTKTKIFTIEELEDFIERIDDDEIKNIRGYVPTVISHIILND